MRSASLIKTLRALPLVLLFLAHSVCLGQESDGTEELDKAFDLKIKAESTKDLDQVVKLCESAIKKGLDQDGEQQAKTLAASSLYEHADQLGQRIFASRGQDRRWRLYRTQALNRLKKAIEYQPSMVEAYLLTARLNTLPGGDQEDAAAAIDKAVELAGEDRKQLSSALFMRATLSDDEEAKISDLNQAIKIDPNNMDAIRVRAAYYLQNDQAEEAVKDINSWLDSGQGTTANYVAVARSLMAMGTNFDDKLKSAAIDIMDKAIEHDPENPLPHTVRAQINVLAENLDDAVEDATNALKLDDKNIGALLLRATIYSEKMKLDEALEDINKVLELEPLLVQGIQMRGMILSQQEKFGKAIEDIRLLSESDPSNQFLQRQLAMLHNANDEPTEAIKIYDKLLKYNSEDQWKDKSNPKKMVFISRRAASLRGRGDARLSTGEHQLAVEDYTEALKLGEELRKVEEEEGTEVSPPDDGVLNNLAWVLATSPFDDVRDGERAIKLATQAAEVTEFKQAHILSTLASGYAETGDFDSAIEWIEKAIEVNRNEGETQPSKRNAEQKESLQKEYLSYKDKKPWRELQNVEEEKAKTKDDDSESDNKDDDDKDEDDDDEDDDKDDDSKADDDPDDKGGQA
jgi:tetratricopeptide (TPR) repeat protein